MIFSNKNKIIFINNINRELISRDLVSEYAYYSALLGLSKSGSIHNFSLRREEISKELGISVPTLYLRLRPLKRLKWVELKGNQLNIMPLEYLTKRLLGEYALDSEGNPIISKKELTINSLKEAKDAVRFLPLIEALENQDKARLDKMAEFDLKVKNREKAFENINGYKHTHTFETGLTRYKIHAIASARQIEKQGEIVKDVINFNIGMSRFKISKLLKLKCKSAAHRFIKRVRAYGWLSEEIKHAVIGKTTRKKFDKLIKKYGNKGLFFSNNRIIKKMTAVLTPNHHYLALNNNCPASERKYKDEGEGFIPKVDRIYDNLTEKISFLKSQGFKSMDSLLQSL